MITMIDMIAVITASFFAAEIYCIPNIGGQLSDNNISNLSELFFIRTMFYLIKPLRPYMNESH